LIILRIFELCLQNIPIIIYIVQNSLNGSNEQCVCFFPGRVLYNGTQFIYEFFIHSERKVHCCQLWYPPEGSKIGFLSWNFSYKSISMLITFVQNFKAKRFTQKRYSKSTSMCSCKLSLQPTLPSSQGLKTFFCYEIFVMRSPTCW